MCGPSTFIWFPTNPKDQECLDFFLSLVTTTIKKTLSAQKVKKHCSYISSSISDKLWKTSVSYIVFNIRSCLTQRILEMFRMNKQNFTFTLIKSPFNLRNGDCTVKFYLSVLFTCLGLWTKRYIVNSKEPLSFLWLFLVLCVFPSNEENKGYSLSSHNMGASWHCWPLHFTPCGLSQGVYWWQEEDRKTGVCCKLIITARWF